MERPTLKSAVESAVCFSEDELLSELQAISPLEDEIRKLEVNVLPEQVRDLLRLMLVTDLDPGNRPSASDVLASREFQAFQMLL